MALSGDALRALGFWGAKMAEQTAEGKKAEASSDNPILKYQNILTQCSLRPWSLS
jgi:hypothetical protein